MCARLQSERALLTQIEGISTHVTAILSVISQCDAAAANQQRSASATNQIQDLICTKLLPLSPLLAQLGWNRVPILRVILVPSSDTLDDVLDQMAASSVPAIYDFQDQKMTSTREGNPTIASNGNTWRKGAIYLAGGSLSLVVQGRDITFESMTILGGVRVLSGGSLTMEKCVVGDSDFGLHLQGSALLVATDVYVVDCKRQSVLLEGSSTATFTDCEITGGENDGLCMEDSSSMDGTRVLLSGIQKNVVCMRGTSKLSLKKSTLKENAGNHCLVAGDAAFVLSSCAVDRGFRNTGAGVLQIED